MKKSAHIIIKTLISLLIILVAFTVYSKYKSNIDIEQDAGQQEQNQTENGEKNEGDEEQEKQQAPDFTLENLDGEKVSLSDYKGKIVLLNFWGVWCPYCVKEMPDLNSANKKLQEEGDAVILAVDVNDTLEEVKEFVSSQNITLPILMDYELKVSSMYGITGYPTTVVVDRDGNIMGYKVGLVTEEWILNLVEKIK